MSRHPSATWRAPFPVCAMNNMVILNDGSVYKFLEQQDCWIEMPPMSSTSAYINMGKEKEK